MLPKHGKATKTTSKHPENPKTTRRKGPEKIGESPVLPKHEQKNENDTKTLAEKY